MAQNGMSVPTYAYAANNPLAFIDVTGLGVVRVVGPEWFRQAVNDYLSSPCG